MKTIVTNMETTAVFTDDGTKRYLLRKTWEIEKPKLAVIMLAPSEASGIELDSTTLLVLNNSSRLGYGSVDILNLFATLNDFSLKQAEDEDVENLDYVIKSAKDVDDIIYCAGVGKAKNKAFIKRQTQILSALLPYEAKLKCLTNAAGTARLQHPLSPAVRTWKLSALKIAELIPEIITTPEKGQEKGKIRAGKQNSKKDSLL